MVAGAAGLGVFRGDRTAQAHAGGGALRRRRRSVGHLPRHGLVSSGVIGLHKPMPGEVPHAATPAPFAERTSTVRLGFQTSEELEALAERLDRAGYPARVVSEQVTAVYVVDPDGCELEIHPASA